MKPMKTFYLRLILDLEGYYVKFSAPDEEAVRRYATDFLGQIWRSIYTEAYFYEVQKRRYPNNTRIVNKDRPIVVTNEEGELD